MIEYTRSIAQRYLFEGDYQRAIPGAMTSLKLVIELFGIKSVDLVPSYLILGEASQGLGNLTQAQEYLSQAEWTVIKSSDCPLPILSKLYRNIAMLQIAEEDFDEALRNLANDVIDFVLFLYFYYFFEFRFIMLLKNSELKVFRFQVDIF